MTTFISILISTILTVSFIYLIGRGFYSHKQLIREYNKYDFLFFTHLIFGVLLILMLS